MSIKNTVKAFLPSNLNLEQILIDNPPSFAYYIDNFKYIISLVLEIPAFNKDILVTNNYVPINKKKLQKKVRDYKLYLEYLFKNKILERDNYYIPPYQHYSVNSVC